MLPFLKNQNEASASAPVDHITRKSDDESDNYDPLLSAAEDLISAIHAKDAKATAEAWRAGNELLKDNQ